MRFTGRLGYSSRCIIQTFKKFVFGRSDWAPRAVCDRIVEILVFTVGFENAKTAIDLCLVVKEWEISRRSLGQNTDIYNQTPSGPGAIISILAIRGVVRKLAFYGN